MPPLPIEQAQSGPPWSAIGSVVAMIISVCGLVFVTYLRSKDTRAAEEREQERNREKERREEAAKHEREEKERTEKRLCATEAEIAALRKQAQQHEVAMATTTAKIDHVKTTTDKFDGKMDTLIQIMGRERASSHDLR